MSSQSVIPRAPLRSPIEKVTQRIRGSESQPQPSINKRDWCNISSTMCFYKIDMRIFCGYVKEAIIFLEQINGRYPFGEY